MRKSRFSDEQIIGILKERAAGMKTAEFCRFDNVHNSNPRRIENSTINFFCVGILGGPAPPTEYFSQLVLRKHLHRRLDFPKSFDCGRCSCH